MAAALARRRRRLAARRRERLSTGDWCSLGDWRGVEALRRRRNSLLLLPLRCCFFGFGAARGSPGGLRGVPGVPRTGPGAGRPLEMGLVS